MASAADRHPAGSRQPALVAGGTTVTRRKAIANGRNDRLYASDFRPGSVRPNYPPLPDGFRRAELHSIATSLDLIERRTSPPLSERERR